MDHDLLHECIPLSIYIVDYWIVHIFLGRFDRLHLPPGLREFLVQGVSLEQIAHSYLSFISYNYVEIKDRMSCALRKGGKTRADAGC